MMTMTTNDGNITVVTIYLPMCIKASVFLKCLFYSFQPMYRNECLYTKVLSFSALSSFCSNLKLYHSTKYQILTIVKYC